MRNKILLYIGFIIICGCSNLNYDFTTIPDINPSYESKNQQAFKWTWDVGLYFVSNDHMVIERIPFHCADYHINVNTFIEPPHCLNCLKIGKPQIDPDGSLNVNVTLRHPFTDQPKYTGFDVRGTIFFQATRFWKKEPPWIGTPKNEAIFTEYIPLYFSRVEDGGGQLLNPDGFTMYLFPGLHIPGFESPIFNYSKGKQANGPAPDSTINGYKVFTNDPDRRMFLVTDVITRTYHIDPPDGEFIFGYVVDACWTPPTKTPVTNPKNDFPPWANCEDGYILASEQIRPFKLKTYGPPTWIDKPVLPEYEERYVTATTVQIYPMTDEWPTVVEIYLICPDLTSDPYLQTHGVAYSQTAHEVIDKDGIIFKSCQGIWKGTYDADPGKYVALLYVDLHLGQFGFKPGTNEWPVMLETPPFFDFVTLNAVAGDG